MRERSLAAPEPEPRSGAASVSEGATGASSAKELCDDHDAPRPVWVMVAVGCTDADLAEAAGRGYPGGLRRTMAVCIFSNTPRGIGDRSGMQGNSNARPSLHGRCEDLDSAVTAHVKAAAASLQSHPGPLGTALRYGRTDARAPMVDIADGSLIRITT